MYLKKMTFITHHSAYLSKIINFIKHKIFIHLVNYTYFNRIEIL